MAEPVKDTSLFRAIIDNIDDGVYFVDFNRRITLWNHAAEVITGYRSEEVLGKFCQDNILNHVDKEGKPLCVIGCPLYATMQDGDSRSAEVLLRHKNGYRVPVNVRTHPVYSNGKVVGAIEIFSPQSPVRYDDNFVESLTNMAMKDTLTGLPNRAFLESYIQYKINEFSRFGQPSAVLIADVDDMGSFNDRYGYQTGDVALQSIAGSFHNNIVAPDQIGRWDSSTFVGVFELHQPNAPYVVADKVRVLISRSGVLYQNNYLALTASIGLTLTRTGDTPANCIARAEKLMKHSKQRGKNCCSLDVPPPDNQA